MNRLERAKVVALGKVRLLADSWDQQFVRSMTWLVQHDPGSVLTPRQKWMLDSELWRFRRQLAGRTDIGLPPKEPVEEDYVRPPSRRLGTQESLI